MRHLPNLLTLLRLLLTLPIAWLLLSERFAAALWLFAVAGASDALDGFLARRFGWVSRVGSVLDPLADKLLLVTSYVCLGLSQVLPWWLPLLVLLRDALIVGGALVYRVLVGALQMRPSLLGKASTLAQIILVLAVLLELSWLPGFAEVRPLLIVTVLLLTLCSGLHYVWAWTRLYRRQRKGVTL